MILKKYKKLFLPFIELLKIFIVQPFIFVFLQSIYLSFFLKTVKKKQIELFISIWNDSSIVD